MDNLLNVNQAAYILKVHPLSIRRYIREGKLKAIKAGGNVRIRESELQSFNRDFTPREKPAPQPNGIPVKITAVKRFTADDPFLRIKGRGASLHLSS